GPATTQVPHSSEPWVMWLGHASVMIGTGQKVIWVDPYMSPRIDWRPDELDAVFSAQHADRRWVDPYGPDRMPVMVADLPTPDVVLITHQDIDHFDIGT